MAAQVGGFEEALAGFANDARKAFAKVSLEISTSCAVGRRGQAPDESRAAPARRWCPGNHRTRRTVRCGIARRLDGNGPRAFAGDVPWGRCPLKLDEARRRVRSRGSRRATPSTRPP